jgi:hypothetical protein
MFSDNQVSAFFVISHLSQEARMRYVQISKKGNYGSFHNFQEHVNSKKSIFENFGDYRNCGNFRNYGNFADWKS